MVSLRLSPSEEARLNQIAQETQQTKSAVIKQALAQYFLTYQAEQSPYSLGEDSFGNYGSGQTDRSRTYKQRLKAKLHDKRPR